MRDVRDIVFNNRENKPYETPDGIKWHSRSVAVTASLFFVYNEEVYVLAEKRSEKMDSPGLWCIPCGYLDWDETGRQAVIREIYEETGLYMDNYRHLAFLNLDHPYYVSTFPSENRQNVVLNYVGLYRFPVLEKKQFDELVKQAESFSSNEVDRVKLIKTRNINRYKWAFDHNRRIISSMDHVQTQLFNRLDREILDFSSKSIQAKKPTLIQRFFNLFK